MTREKRLREFVCTEWCKGQQPTALPRVAYVFLCSCVHAFLLLCMHYTVAPHCDALCQSKW